MCLLHWLKKTLRMLREPWESVKVVLTENLISPVGRSPGCSVFSASCRNSGYLQFDESKYRDNRAFSLVLKRLLVSNTQLLCTFIVFVIT